MTAWGLCPTGEWERKTDEKLSRMHTEPGVSESCEQPSLPHTGRLFVRRNFFVVIWCRLSCETVRLPLSSDWTHLNDRNASISALDFIRFKVQPSDCSGETESLTPSAFRGISTVNMATASETNRRLLKELLERAGNGNCVDCGVAGKETALWLFTLPTPFYRQVIVSSP